MIEAVDRVSIRGRSGIQYHEERLVSRGCEMFHLDVDTERSNQVEGLGQQRDRFARRQPGLGNLGGAEGGNGTSTG